MHAVRVVLRAVRMWLGEGSFVRRLAMVLGATLCVVAGFAIWVLITGSLDTTAAHVLLSTVLVGACAITGLAGATVLERADARRPVGLVTIMLSGFELILALAVIWTGLTNTSLDRALGATSALLAAFLQASLMLSRVRARDGGAVRWLTAGAVAFSMLAALAVAGGLVFAATSAGAGYARLLGVLVVLGTLFTLLAPIARRLGGHGVGGGDAGEASGAAGPVGAAPEPERPGSVPPPGRLDERPNHSLIRATRAAAAPAIRRALLVHPPRAARAARREPAAD